MITSKIGVALSGGGFRATLFHLGVVRFLHDTEHLPQVRCITSVSGGSILAAHLALNWNRYANDFNSASAEIVHFTMADIRGRILRRWVLAWITLFPRIISRGRWKLTNMLKDSYSELFKNATLGSLPATPDVHILSTSMTKGGLWSCDRTGVSFDRDTSTCRISTTTLHLSLAVAASSAFPALFPPIRIDNKVLMCDRSEFSEAEYLTDGGVYDNLGINKLLALETGGNDLDLMIISDAGGNFDWALDRPYTSFLPRNVRASDLLMRRVSLLQIKQLEFGPDHVHRIRIGRVVPPYEGLSARDPGTQRALRNIRTDLDAFSHTEAHALIAHGYAVARQTLLEAGVVGDDAPYSWIGLELIARPSVKPWGDEAARSSQARKARLWSSRDWVTWATTCIVALYCCLPMLLFLVQHLKLRNLQTRNANISKFVNRLDPNVRLDLMAKVSGSIEIPTQNEKVGKTFRCAGVITGLEPGLDLWLAVEKGDGIWPKEGRLVPGPDNTWTTNVFEEGRFEEGRSDRFSIALYVADPGASKRIQDWLDEGARTRSYEPMKNLQGARRIARIDNLSVIP